ncbi:hypothetical protein [Azohydromonas sediminis]|uniref:hypothetical protein n=1 Tax=Azohydromonas sediminis TaxID=2259674 RepID=UPI000E6464AC|nr:hypothetical protein [Azohydromonas sediminis]
MTTPTEPTDEQLEQWLRASRALEDAPAWLVERVIARGPVVARPARATLAATLRRVLAQLVSDTGAVPALALGLRSSGPQLRQLLYAADGRDIDLRVAPAGADGGFLISGQVLGPELHGEVRLTGDGVDLRTALDDGGEFRFGPLPAGRWQLTLTGADVQIDLPVLELAAA